MGTVAQTVSELLDSAARQYYFVHQSVMIDSSQPVKVIINGREVYHQKTGIDRAFMVQHFLQYFDRTMLWVTRISLPVN